MTTPSPLPNPEGGSQGSGSNPDLESTGSGSTPGDNANTGSTGSETSPGGTDSAGSGGSGVTNPELVKPPTPENGENNGDSSSTDSGSGTTTDGLSSIDQGTGSITPGGENTETESNAGSNSDESGTGSISPDTGSSGGGVDTSKFTVSSDSIYPCTEPGYFSEPSDCREFYTCKEITPGQDKYLSNWSVVVLNYILRLFQAGLGQIGGGGVNARLHPSTFREFREN